MTEQGKRAAIYVRISKQVKGKDKTGNQEAECRRLADRLGLTVVSVYEDDGISARSGKTRPGWEDLLKDLGAGGVDYLLAQEETRFVRQPMDMITLTSVCKKQGIRWHTVLGGEIDPAQASGKFVAGLRALLGELEVDLKAERQVLDYSAARQKGLPVGGGVRPFGYLKGRLKIHPVEGPEVRWAYEHLLAGGSLYTVVKRWADNPDLPTSRGGRWSYSSVQKVLTRVHNCGRYSDGQGGILEGYQGAWEPLVDVDTWEAIRARLTDPARSLAPDRTPRWLLSGVARCVCGRTMRVGHLRRRGEPVPNYRCNAGRVGGGPGPHTTARCEELDALVRHEVLAAVMHAPAHRVGGATDSSPTALQGRLETRRREIRTRLGELADSLADTGVPIAKIREAMALLSTEQTAVDEQLGVLRGQDAHAALIADLSTQLWRGQRVSIADAAVVSKELGERFDVLELRQRQQLVRAFLRVTVLPRGTEDRFRVERRDPLRPGAFLEDEPEVVPEPAEVLTYL